jgi:hypothetical protein
LSNPCVHGGSCLDLDDHYKCNCTAGFEGVNCEIDIDECASSPCVINSTVNCTDLVNGVHCHCQPGFSGAFCQLDIDECASSPCVINSTVNCTDLVNGVHCHCQPGFSGAFCQLVVVSTLPPPTCEGWRVFLQRMIVGHNDITLPGSTRSNVRGRVSMTRCASPSSTTPLHLCATSSTSNGRLWRRTQTSPRRSLLTTTNAPTVRVKPTCVRERV